MANERRIELTERREEVREKNEIELVEFEFDEIYSQFEENITDIRAKFSTADKLLRENDENSCKDIWRSQIVFLDSALDYYMHCITKYGMNKMFRGEWNKTDKYNKFMVPLKEVEHAIQNSEDTNWFSQLVNNSYAKDTFMDSSCIKGQLELIGVKFKDVADEVYHQRGCTIKTHLQLKQFLNKLFHRRNSIAHQSDRFHENGVKQEITREDVENFIEDVEKIVSSIQNRIREKNLRE